MDTKLISNIAQMSRLSDEDLAILLTCATRREMTKGAIVLHAGDVCRAFYLVESGFLRTYYCKSGKEINLNFTFEGSFTSNLKSLKNRQPSQHIIEAGEESVVWILNQDMISEIARTNSALALFVRRLAINILLASEAHSDLLKILTPAERYEHIEEHSPQLLQRISLTQMASYLGVTRETISRIRAKRH